jgi:alcohol dehydrogenase (cytochrome c)
MAPLIANGKVMVSVSGGEVGVRGYVVAVDAETGKKSGAPIPSAPGNGET